MEVSSQLVLMWDRMGPENEIECVEDFTRLTFDTIGLCAFNMRFNEFYSEEPHPFAKQLAATLVECGRRASRPKFLNNWLFFRAEQERQENMTRIRALSDKIVRDREVNPKPDATDILNVLLHGVDKETGEKLPSENVRCQIATFLAAGYDTTASTLSFVYYYLCDNPEVLRKAQQEVDEVVGDKIVTPDMLPKLVYIAACIKESLRLNSPVNILNRDAREDTVIGEKYLIKKGVSVSTLLRHLHRDPEVWGDDADEFRPERMLNGGFEALPPTAWKPVRFNPHIDQFGNGSRVCIGRGFSEQEMLLNFAQVLQRFTVEKADPNYKLVLKSTLTTKPEGFRMRVKRRPGRNLMFGLPGSARAQATNPQPRQSGRGPRDQTQLKPISVFVGGNMGTCEGLARDLAEKAPEFGLEVIDIRDLDDAVDNLPTDKPIIIITSSYEGKPPDNARKFVTWIERLSRESAQLPKGTRFAVFGAGNSDWHSTFHRIPKLADNTLAQLGAERIVDACHSNVKLGVMGPWEEWIEQLGASLTDKKTTSQTQVGVDVSIESATVPRQVHGTEELSNATVLCNRELADTSAGAAKRHVDIRLPPGSDFVPGDYLVIQGRNPEQAVRRVLARFDLKRNDIMTIKTSKKSFLPTHPTTVGHFLSTVVELATPITKRQLLTFLHWTDEKSDEYKILDGMQQDDAYEALLEERFSIIDVLEEVPGLRLPFNVYLDLLLPLVPRQYSISSSQKEQDQNDIEAHGAIASVTFDVFEAPALSGRGIFRGVVSNYLSACHPGDRIQCFVRPNTLGFRLPADTETPVVMVAAGTGIAPMRSFIAERAGIQKSGAQKLGPALLFFGCRNPEKDYIYRPELEKWQGENVVSVIPCFSRPSDAEKGRHVSDALWEDRSRVWDLLQKGGKIYVCGSAARLGRSSAETLKRIYSDKTGKSGVEADQWLDDLKTSGVYVRDVY
ncbi:cytochrome P450 [Pestalotiopsis sp. NC0098]|nr:cytochrome P450 [Pestalotiopsis sp. NC0098]